jgi:hypothetical protein
VCAFRPSWTVIPVHRGQRCGPSWTGWTPTRGDAFFILINSSTLSKTIYSS